MIKTKEKNLANLRSKPDPRKEAPAVHAEIAKLNKQMCKEVGIWEWDGCRYDC